MKIIRYLVPPAVMVALALVSATLLQPKLPAWAQGFSLPNGSAIVEHIISIGPIPAAGGGSCGAVAVTAGSTDTAGSFTTAGASTCQVTFARAFATKPFCIIQSGTNATKYAYTWTATGFVMGTTDSDALIAWHCIGQQGN